MLFNHKAIYSREENKTLFWRVFKFILGSWFFNFKQKMYIHVLEFVLWIDYKDYEIYKAELHMVDEKKQALGRALYKSMVPKDIPQRTV